MKSFLTKIILFLSAYVFIAWGIKKISAPSYYWGNDYFASKKNVYDKKNNINVVFFGSSRVYRHVIPSLFDSIVNATGSQDKIRSFNFGCPATFPPESYRLLENFISEERGIKYVFLELNERPSFDENVFTIRGNYWMDMKEVFFLDRMLSESSAENKNKQRMFIWSAKMQDLLTTRNIFSSHRESDGFAGPLRDGYYSLEQQVKDEHGNKGLENPHIALLKDTSVLQARAKSVKKEFAEGFKMEKENEALSARLNSIMSFCKGRAIKIVFLVTPRTLSRDFACAYKNLPAENKMELCRPDSFPGLYLFANSYDIGHLNENGARNFTTLLAGKFAALRNPAR